MKISVIIPALNEASRIGGLIESLLRQDPACEVIVADGESLRSDFGLSLEIHQKVQWQPDGRFGTTQCVRDAVLLRLREQPASPHDLIRR